jgi:hypothetical protein
VDNNLNRCITIFLSSDDRSQINLFSSDNNEKFLYVSFIFFIYGSQNFSRRGQVIRKWSSSSILFLHKLQIWSSIFVPIYLPFSMFKLWAFILNFVNSFLCCLIPNNKYGSNLKIDLNFLYVCTYVPRYPLKPGGELRCSGRVGSSCYTSGNS